MQTYPAYGKQLFPVVDFITRRQIAVKPRSLVHGTGLWHEGVQAFILRTDRQGHVETFVQWRSSLTDLSAGKIDQSLATQVIVEDNGELARTLTRGLNEEFGLSQDEVRHTRIGAEGWLRISKKYAEDPTRFNREFISLFLVQLADPARPILLNNPKIESGQWMDWDDFVRLVHAEPFNFTKTSRYYLLNRPLYTSIKAAIGAFIRREPTPVFPFSRSGCYSYAQGPDLYINKYGSYGEATIETVNIEERARRVFSHSIRSFDVYDAQSDPEPVIRYTTTLGRKNYILRGEKATGSPRRAHPASKTAIESVAERLGREATRIRQASPTEVAASLEFKLHSNLSKLRSRVEAGDFLTVDPRTGEVPPQAEGLVLLAMPGTFGPPHLNHVDLMLEAFKEVSARRRERRFAYAGFLVPLGDNAPGPNGQLTWKPDSLPALKRHGLSSALTDNLTSPLIQTAPASLLTPGVFGSENAFKLIELFNRPLLPGTIDFYIVAGSDTFCRWHRNFADLIQTYRSSHGANISYGIVTFDDVNYPVAQTIAANGYQNVTVIQGWRNLGIHSSQFRENGDTALLTDGVRRKQDEIGHP
jgi:hypothetical protein